MAGDDDRYRLVVFDAVEDRSAVRDLFCRVLGLHPTDAMQWVARSPGAWPKPLSAGEAKALLDGLFDLGEAAEAWRLDRFPDLMPPRVVHDAACLEAGFRVKGLRGEPTHWAPWDRIELIAAGRIDAQDEFRPARPPGFVEAMATGVFALFKRPGVVQPRRRRADRIIRDPTGEVIIVRRDPQLAFRIAEGKMNYAALGDRLRPSAAENFPLFLAELCARAVAASITPTTGALLGRGDLDAATFPNSQALLDYATHRLLWARYRRDRDAELPTES